MSKVSIFLGGIVTPAFTGDIGEEWQYTSRDGLFCTGAPDLSGGVEKFGRLACDAGVRMVRTESVSQMLCGPAECFASLSQFPSVLQDAALCKVSTADVAGRRPFVDGFPEQCEGPIHIGRGLLELKVDYEGDSVRVTIPPPVEEETWTDVAPNAIEMQCDGTAKSRISAKPKLDDDGECVL
jgi:hypothetical protein